MFSWIHIEDVCRIIEFLKQRKDLKGIFNASAPTPVTNKELMEHMRKAMGRRGGLPAPEWMLQMGAVFHRHGDGIDPEKPLGAAGTA